ncbi:MAG: OmpH family outer membrane protein [Bacteroidales bacterium]|nr:OmpH family outer membrane protein [Bacteroidales bacterium]MDT8373997.1 OmpH family outer membrane protein [Bacteroidales bacterium]
MKKISVVKNILTISALAVAVIFAAPGCGNTPTESTDGELVKQTSGIAFVELDTVIARFDMAKDKSTELEEKTRSSEAELTSKSQAFDRDVRDYQNKAQKGLITRATAAEMEQTLAQQQQNLVALRDEMAYNLNEEGMVAQRQVLEYINQYLAEFNADHGYQYILAKQFPGPILYSDSTMDITEAVVEGLNKKYNAEKEKK